MYDRSGVQRHASYSGAHYVPPATSKQYPTAPSTSSAFSASANPNEDWTKISDLAERRRIQNRIAQRNYRKKLKKRLEDLERRAGSSSASPEQTHVELAESEPLDAEHTAVSPRHRSSSSEIARDHTPDVLAQQYVLPSDDRGMFSQQFTRQLSTSPPPFSYAPFPGADALSYSTYPPAAPYCNLGGSAVDMPLYPQYLSNLQQPYRAPGVATPPIKQEYYGGDEVNPFSMSYASMAGVDISAVHPYDAAAYTPPLLDSFDHSIAGSPPELSEYPRTPGSMPRTPPVSFYDHF